jgi:hypothetical protein
MYKGIGTSHYELEHGDGVHVVNDNAVKVGLQATPAPRDRDPPELE